MYTLYGQAFINMIKSFYPKAHPASGGREVVIRCKECGDSKDPNHAHLYISVPQTADELSFYQCKKCPAHGIVDDIFLRKYGCDDSRVLVDVLSHNDQLKRSPKYRTLKNIDIYPLHNAIGNQPWNQIKLEYINSRIGAYFTVDDLTRLKIFLNLYDVVNANRLEATRYPNIMQALNENFIGFISYDNSYGILRKYRNVELYQSINKRYIVYEFLGNKTDDSKNFYVIPTSIDVENPAPVRINIAEGAFDILSIYCNLREFNSMQEVYISSSGKSYLQALSFILQETGIVNFEIHIYADNDVNEYELNRLILNPISYLACNIIIHRNAYPGEKDFGVPVSRIKDTVRVIPERFL